MRMRSGQLATWLALLTSLMLHVSAFGLVHTIREWRESAVTESRPAEPEPTAEAAPPPPPEQEEFRPGIEEGARAVVTWIGYEEYEKHLARLAEMDQAAFTSAIARGVPESPSVDPAEEVLQTPPAQQATAAPVTEAPAETPELVEAPPKDEPEVARASPTTPEQQTPATTAPVESIRVENPDQPIEESIPEPVESDAPDAPEEASTPTKIPVPEPVESERVEEPAESRVEPRPPVEDAPIEPVIEPDTALLPNAAPTPMPGVAPTPVAPPQGEPVPEQSQPSEKDAPATSTRQVPETKWDNGKPLAVEGMELKPFSLYRHITWDSRDIMFAQQLNRGRWEGRVVRNPIVSMRFDRHGRVGEVKIIRPSGFAPLDQLYLKSWISRWTATDKRLAELRPDELTNAIQIKIVFIDEPAPKAPADSETPNGRS